MDETSNNENMATVGGGHKTNSHHEGYVQEEKEKGRTTRVCSIKNKIVLARNETE